MMMIVLLLFLQKQNLANAIYLFGLGTLLYKIRQENANASMPEQRSRQKRRPSVHAVKHRSTSRTNTDVSVRSAEKYSVERSKEAQLCVRVCA